MVANDNPTSPTSSIIENMGSPLSSNAADLSHIDHSLRVAAAATNVTPVQGNGSTSPTSVSSTAHPTFNDNMDVDMDDIPSMQQCASADNADHLQELADATNQLTKLIAVVSTKLPTLHGEARLTALQEIQDLALTVKTSNELLTSFAPTQSNNKPTTLVANLPQSTQSASIRPDNLPYFQWEGSVFDARLPWSVDVDACLTKFEDVMNFYSLAFDKEFLRLVPPMLSPTQRTTWYQSFLMNHQAPTWVDFKSCFKARYGISVIDDRQKCAAELMNISFQPNESFHSLVDKFNDLRRRAFDQLPQPFLLVSRLMLILPSSLRSQVNIVRQSKGLTSITADTVIKIAQELLASMTPSEVNAAMGYTAPATPAPPSSKAAAAPTATTTIPIQHGYAGKVNKPAPSGNRFPPHGSSNNMYTSPSRRGQKYCTYHKSRAHNTNECNAYAAALSSASTSERGGNPHCDNCGAPNYIEGALFPYDEINDNEGRVSPSSPNAAATTPPSNMPLFHLKKYCTFHRFSKHNTGDCRAFAEHLQSLASELLISSDVVASSASATHGMSSSTAAPSSTVQSDERPNESMDIDTIIATAAQKCKSNEFSSLPINKSNSLLVPLIIL